MRHFLQSAEWRKFQEALGKTVFEEKGEDFAFLAVLEKTKVGNYLYLPYGPSVKNLGALEAALKAVRELARKEKCFLVRIEPTEKFSLEEMGMVGKNLGCELVKSKDLNPADTWVLNLQQSKEEILTGMSQGTRTRHNQFGKKGLEVVVSSDVEDIKELTRLQGKLAKEKGINTFAEEYLRTELEQEFASLYMVRYEEKIISASLFFDDWENGVRFYMQSATDMEYKKLPATVGLLTAAIFDAKEKGLKWFDFWGIAPEEAGEEHPWAGFTQFKKSFGGEARHYSGTYDLVVDGARYKVYAGLRRINLKMRKMRARG